MSSLRSTLKPILGPLGVPGTTSRGAAGKGKKKPDQKELGLLSLSELIGMREEQGQTLTKQREELAGLEKRQATFQEGRTASKRIQEGLGAIESLKSAIEQGAESEQLSEINTRIQELTRQRLGTRTRRATAVSTLLSRRR